MMLVLVDDGVDVDDDKGWLNRAAQIIGSSSSSQEQHDVRDMETEEKAHLSTPAAGRQGVGNAMGSGFVLIVAAAAASSAGAMVGLRRFPRREALCWRQTRPESRTKDVDAFHPEAWLRGECAGAIGEGGERGRKGGKLSLPWPSSSPPMEESVPPCKSSRTSSGRSGSWIPGSLICPMRRRNALARRRRGAGGEERGVGKRTSEGSDRSPELLLVCLLVLSWSDHGCLSKGGEGQELD